MQSRREFLLGAASLGLTVWSPGMTFPSALTKQVSSAALSSDVISSLEAIVLHYRQLQRSSINIEENVKSHVAIVQQALEHTINDKQRRELWRILAFSQLLIRLSITDKEDLGRAKTWNEQAIASAQACGDTHLQGAALGHLAHLHLIWQGNPTHAHQLLSQAQDMTKGQLALAGWFAIVDAAIAAQAKQPERCETAIVKAEEIAHRIADKPRYVDAYFTDFSQIGMEAFAANSLIKSKRPQKALEYLSSMDITHLSTNRQASALYDFSHAHMLLGNLAEAESYAFQSIDKAVATNRLYILPRFLGLVKQIQKKHPQEPHAQAIFDYIHDVALLH